MTQIPCSPDLVETFYQAYNDTSGSQQDRLGRCESILDALRTCGEVDAAYLAWSLLFEGILANERERDWGQGERLFRAALAAGQGHDPLLEARACLALGVTCHTLDRWSESIAFGHQALPALAGLDKPIDVASAWTNMAIACTWASTAAPSASANARASGIASKRWPCWTPCRQPRALQLAGFCLQHPRQPAQQGGPLARCHRGLSTPFGHLPGGGLSLPQRDLLGNLGQVYEQIGPATFDQAAEAYQAALRSIKSARIPIWRCLAELAGLTQARAAAQALTHYLQAIDQVEEIRSGISTAEARAGFFATVANAYTHAILLAVALGDGHGL